MVVSTVNLCGLCILHFVRKELRTIGINRNNFDLVTFGLFCKRDKIILGCYWNDRSASRMKRLKCNYSIHRKDIPRCTLKVRNALRRRPSIVIQKGYIFFIYAEFGTSGMDFPTICKPAYGWSWSIVLCPSLRCSNKFSRRLVVCN